MAEVLLQIDGISKSFPGVKANDEVSFQINSGEIHALLGENGAGKSTLLKCLAGITQPSTGTIKTRGELATLLDLGLGFCLVNDLIGAGVCL